MLMPEVPTNLPVIVMLYWLTPVALLLIVIAEFDGAERNVTSSSSTSDTVTGITLSSSTLMDIGDWLIVMAGASFTGLTVKVKSSKRDSSPSVMVSVNFCVPYKFGLENI